MLFIIIGLSVLVVLLLIDRAFLVRKNDELVELCEVVFDNEQDMMNKLEALHKGLQESNYAMYQCNDNEAIQKQMRKNHIILKENQITNEN